MRTDHSSGLFDDDCIPSLSIYLRYIIIVISHLYYSVHYVTIVISYILTQMSVHMHANHNSYYILANIPPLETLCTIK